jgi:hypothetical protein
MGLLLRFALTVENLARRIEQIDIGAKRIKDQCGTHRQTYQHGATHP